MQSRATLVTQQHIEWGLDAIRQLWDYTQSPHARASGDGNAGQDPASRRELNVIRKAGKPLKPVKGYRDFFSVDDIW